LRRIFAALAALSIAVLVAAATGSAAPRQPQPLHCVGLGDVQILTPPAIGSQTNWGSAQLVGGGHLTPVAFRFSAYDNTISATIFDSGQIVKAGGNANQNQATTACSQIETATLADFLEPGDTPPPGAQLTDTVTFTISATVVAK
jgi:hypothetical protein